MKLWEVLKELTDDPTLEFKLVEDGKTWTLKTDHNAYFVLECDSEHYTGRALGFSGNLLINDDRWVEVGRPVTWQEAIKAWGAGRIVSVEVGGCKYKLTHDDSIFGLSERMINLGVWYVED